MVELHADHGTSGSRVESVDIAAGTADITGTRGEARARINFNDFHGNNQRYALSIAAVLHRIRHLRIPETSRRFIGEVSGVIRTGEAIRFYFQKVHRKRQERSEPVWRTANLQSRNLLNNGIERMAYGALMVGGVIFALGVTEEGKTSGAAIHGRSGRKFILSGSAQVAGADDDHAVPIAVALAADQLRVEESGRISRGFCGVAKFGQGIGKARVSSAIRFYGSRNGFQVRQSLLLVTRDCGLVPFDFKRRQIQKEHADGENFPGRVFPNEPHQDVMGFTAGRSVGIGCVTNVNRKQSDTVSEVRAAKLDVRGASGSGATNGRPAGSRGKSRFACAVEKNEAFHEFDTRCGSEARE